MSTDRLVNTSIDDRAPSDGAAQAGRIATDPTGVRERILSAARQLIAAQGYAATSLRQVAEASGVTKPMVYYYFGSKEGLYRSLLDDVQSRLRQIVHAVDAAPPRARERLLALIRGHFDLVRGHHVDMQLWFAATLGPPGAGPRFEPNDALQHAASEQVERIVAAGLASGELRSDDPTMISLAIHGAVTALYARGLDRGADPDPADVPERLLELLLRGIADATSTPSDAPRD